MKIRLFYTAILLLNLAGCSSKGPGDKYLKQITELGHKNYQINKAELIAKYNLLNLENKGQCLFSRNYGQIVGDASTNQKFLGQLQKKIRKVSEISSATHQKLSMIYHHITALSKKYPIAPSKEIKYLKNLQFALTAEEQISPFDLMDQTTKPNLNNTVYNKLILADQIITKIPIFLPETAPILTSKFGIRKHPISGMNKFHKGIDLAGKHKSMIYASANGKVSMVARSPSYGNFILINHANGLVTRYAHLSKVYLTQGDNVFQGELIAHQGNSGASIGEHLHFEIIHQGKPLDPMLFIGPEYYCRQGIKQ